MSTVKLQAGDFITRQIDAFGGPLIRVGQVAIGDGFRVFEHAAIVVSVNTSADGSTFTVTVVEAMPGGAVKATYGPYPVNDTLTPPGWLTSSDYYAGDFASKRLPVTMTQRGAVVSAANASIGIPYSELDYFAIATHHFHVPVPGLREFISSEHHAICSQLVDMIAQKAAINLFADHRWNGDVTPGDLSGLLLGIKTGR